MGVEGWRNYETVTNRYNGKRIKACRKKIKGMTQEVLADRIGKTRHYVSMIEVDRASCSMDTLIDIADVLHTSIDYLLGRGPEIEYIESFNQLMSLLPESMKKDMLRFSDGLVNLLNEKMNDKGE